jgi:magnesium transporter
VSIQAAERPPAQAATPETYYLSDLIGMSICGDSGERIAQLRDLIVRVGGGGYPSVTGLVTRSTWKSFFIPWEQVASLDQKGFHLTSSQVNLHPFHRREGEMLLGKDVLDKQVVDVKGRRVVRTNDLRLVYRPPRPSKSQTLQRPRLFLIGIDVNAPALLRRLLPGRFRQRVERTTVIDWRDIEQLASESPGVRLKIDHKKISKLHPADIANIIEELTSNQGAELFEQLDDATAADTLEEMPEELQADFLEEMDEERAADILEEMNPDDAADVLATLTEGKRDDLLRRMDADEAQDIRELLQYQHDDAGGLMTTDYVAVPADMPAAVVIEFIRHLEDVPDVVHYVYAVDDLEHEKLLGITDLQAILRAPPDKPVREFMSRDFQTVPPDEDAEETAKIMSEYNLLALPVVDAEKKLLGIVTVDDAMELLLPDQFRRQVPRVFS